MENEGCQLTKYQHEKGDNVLIRKIHLFMDDKQSSAVAGVFC